MTTNELPLRDVPRAENRRILRFAVLSPVGAFSPFGQLLQNRPKDDFYSLKNKLRPPGSFRAPAPDQAAIHATSSSSERPVTGWHGERD
ncbi:hypothetical protein KCP75_26030 [Salmonella enterica subsp. enterica]|nr:hypothetical protein KCP75_26030 [Salmonella enterica subsp. enterica]